jgi:hypothetical protein
MRDRVGERERELFYLMTLLVARFIRVVSSG